MTMRERIFVIFIMPYNSIPYSGVFAQIEFSKKDVKKEEFFVRLSSFFGFQVFKKRLVK